MQAETRKGKGPQSEAEVVVGPVEGEIFDLWSLTSVLIINSVLDWVILSCFTILEAIMERIIKLIISGGPLSPSKPSLVPGAAVVRLEWEDRAPNGVGALPIVGHVIQAKRVARALGNMTLRTPAEDDDR